MRGQKTEIGATRVAANGYHYTKTIGGWRLTHHIVAEQKYGEPVTSQHLVRFIDGKRTNLKSNNIEVVPRGRSTLRRRKAILESRIEQLQAELEEVEKEMLK